MRRGWWIFLLLTCACVPRGPALQVSDPVWNLGTIVTNSNHEKLVELFNAGDAPLVIETVEECCGFYGKLAHQHALAPGARTTLTLQLSAFKAIGDLSAEIVVVSNDPVHPRFPLMVVGQIVPKFYALAVMHDRTIDLGVLEQGVEVPLLLRIENPGNAPLTIRGLEQRGTMRQVGSLPEIAPAASGVLEFRYSAVAVGPIDETIVVSTNDALNRTLSVRVRGYVVARDERRHALVIYPVGDKAVYDVNEKVYRYNFRLSNQGSRPVLLAPGEKSLPGLRLTLPEILEPGATHEASAILPLIGSGAEPGQLELRLILPFVIQ